MKRVLLSVICLISIFSVGYALASTEGGWVIPAGNEKFIGETFDSGENSQIVRTDAINIEKSRINITISKPDDSGVGALIYLTHSKPSTAADDCLELSGLWLCAAGASFVDPLPGAYLGWLMNRNLDVAKLVSLFVEERRKDIKSEKPSFRQRMTTYILDRSGFLIRQFYVFWLALFFMAVSVAFKNELSCLLKTERKKLPQFSRLMLLALFLILLAAAVFYIYGSEFSSNC